MFPRIDILAKEARFTISGLRREPWFTFAAILLLSVGIGFTSAVFTLLWQVVYAQLPVPDPSRLFALNTDVNHMGRSDTDSAETVVSAPAFRYLAQHFTASAGAFARAGHLANIETPQGPRHLRVELVSGNFFAAIGVKPVLGRPLLPEENRVGAASQVAVLSYAFWQEAFGGEWDALNRTIRVNAVPLRIVGVMPPAFFGLVSGQAPQIYVPYSLMPAITPGWNNLDDWSVRWLNVFFRLPPQVSATRAQAELKLVYRAATRQELATEPPQPADYLHELERERVLLIPASQGSHELFDQWRRPLVILQWLTASILLLTCINVAGLITVRAVKQKQEMLVRYAMGASRAALIRLYLLQTIFLAIAGGIAAIWLTRAFAMLLLARIDNTGAVSAGFTSYALGVHWFAAIAAALVVALFPGFHVARMDLAKGLAESASTHSAGRSYARTRRALAALQIALSLVLLIAAGLFAKSLRMLTSVRVGFNPEHLMLFSVDPKLAGSTAPSARLLYSNIARALQQAPGVLSVTYGTGGPFPQELDSAVLIPDPKKFGPKHESGAASIIGPRYFTTLGIPIVKGREFDERDRAGAPRGVIMNQTLARELFARQDPIGQPVIVFNGLDPNWQGTVIGVAADYYMSWKRSGMKLIYTSAQQAANAQAITFYVRTAAMSTLTERSIRDLVSRQAPALSAFDVQSMPARMQGFASTDRAMTLLIGTFAALALVISVIGVYGVVAYTAGLRTSEFGVRFAIGAQRRDILWLIFREAVFIVTAGLLLALPLAWIGLSLARNQLYKVTLHDPEAWITAILTLIFCSFVAAVVPAARATRMNVQAALRHN